MRACLAVLFGISQRLEYRQEYASVRPNQYQAKTVPENIFSDLCFQDVENYI